MPAYATRERFNVSLFTLYIVMHVVALSAFWTFSWPGLLSFVVMYFLTICLGITLCYHRLLAHRSYTAYKPLAYVCAFLGCLAMQKGPVWWVACHRLHHSRVDKEGDPH